MNRLARLDVRDVGELVAVRHLAKKLAAEAGLGSLDETKLLTAASELSRNMVLHGGGGEVQGQLLCQGLRRGVRLVFADNGPGIADIEEAMRDGFSSKGTLGLGLPGARRLVDHFAIASRPGQGTSIEVIKWKR
jgi:serine/threonine-protein kinase RsbT